MRATTWSSMLLVGLLGYGCSSSSPPADEGDPVNSGAGGDITEGVTTTGGAGQTSGGGGGPDVDASSTGNAGSGNGSAGSPTPLGDGGFPHATAVGPVPPADWVNVTGNLAGMASECGNAAQIYANPWKDMLITGVARHGLYASTDGAATWVPIGAGAGSSAIRNRMIVILFDPITPDTFWESGIYGWESPWSEGAFITKDSGATFKGYAQMGAEAQSSNDSISVDFTDPARKTMLSGGHEQGASGPMSQGMFLSKDGTKFDDIMPKLPMGLGFCTTTLVLDSMNLLIGCANSYKGETPAIIRSGDGGATWKSVSPTGGSGQPLLASDGTIYWSAAGGGMLKSTDKGLTFTMVADKSKTGGLPPFALPDGRIVSVSGMTVVVSADKGVTWKSVTKAIPFQPNGLTYSAHRRAFYASHFDCSNNVPANAHARFGWDYEANP